MSHRANFWLAQLDPVRVKPGAFRVLFHLCDHHNDEREPAAACFPSQETLMRKTGMSNGALNDTLARLEGDGLIRRIRSTIPGTRTRRTYYVLACDFDREPGQTPVSGACSNSGQPEPVQEQTPENGGTNSGFEPNKLRPTGEEPVRNSKEHKGRDSAQQETGSDKPAGFDLFWRTHPKPRNRDRSLGLWLDAEKRQVDALCIIDAARRYREDNRGKDPRYLAASDNWLEQRRWEDGTKPGPEMTADEKAKATVATAEMLAERIRAGKFVAPSALTQAIVAVFRSRNLLPAELMQSLGIRT